jgi:hypothetical protein
MVTPIDQSETSFHLDRTPFNARRPVDVVKLDPVIRAVLSDGASDAHLHTLYAYAVCYVCMPYSDHPLSGQSTAVDRRLLGS